MNAKFWLRWIPVAKVQRAGELAGLAEDMAEVLCADCGHTVDFSDLIATVRYLNLTPEQYINFFWELAGLVWDLRDLTLDSCVELCLAEQLVTAAEVAELELAVA